LAWGVKPFSFEVIKKGAGGDKGRAPRGHALSILQKVYSKGTSQGDKGAKTLGMMTRGRGRTL